MEQRMYKVCPCCLEVTSFTEKEIREKPDAEGKYWLTVVCKHCSRRIRVSPYPISKEEVDKEETSVEQRMYKVCPCCLEVTSFTEEEIREKPDAKGKYWLTVVCEHCGRRIKVSPFPISKERK